MLAEVLAAVLVGVSLFWMVAQPLLAPEAEVAFVEEPPDPEETPRGQALLALKEIEFDRATGKLSDEDYQELHARYSSRALALLDPATPTAAAATEPDPVEVLLTRRARPAVASVAVAAPAGCPADASAATAARQRPEGQRRYSVVNQP